MIKIDYKYFSNSERKSFIDSYFEIFNNPKKNRFKIINGHETAKERFNKYRLKNYIFRYIFFKIKFDEIIKSDYEELNCILNLIECKLKKLKKEHLKAVKHQIKKVFDYDKFQDVIRDFFEDNLNPRICYYCNKNYINVYDVDKGKKNEFTIDHFYDKGAYPYLALSLYNFVPSCYTCNSKLKKTKKLNCLSPASENFDFDEKVKFKLFFSKDSKNLNFQSKKDIDIPLKENYSKNYPDKDKNKDYISVFKLNERYAEHRDIAFDLIEKSQKYPESKLKEMAKILGISENEIKKDIFDLIDEDSNLADKPFSKLIKDISKELEL